MYLGIDIGSSSSKAVILDARGKILAGEVINLGTGSKAGAEVVERALAAAGLRRDDVRYTVVTGYGRMKYAGADKQITEITCHGKGVVSLYPKARTVIDIGGQDAKCIRLDERGRVANFVMNDKCAAGTGRFLEVMARVLDCEIHALEELAERAKTTISISSTCTVFAESEVISQLSQGASREDVAYGAHKSIARRVVAMAERIGIMDQVVMTGGVSLNRGILRALREESGKRIYVPESPQTIGALGAAILARQNGSGSF
ncbi:MAG: acyl-CoA dehydratase activase [Clostridiales Family XIII bacterium]|jgi:predicted CoA-substrate-specific enzyme activase|nr:acyl-CoA dehydratase activase [Clostridiales Family XIII bacterium]